MKHPIKHTFLILLILFVWNQSLLSQEIEFQKLVPADERTFDFVTGITQDANGFMWFSTKRGLYSYDGNKLTSFKTQPLDPNSIKNNNLESVYIEDNGKIWLGSLGSGIDLYEPKSGIFTHFQHDPKNPASLINDTVTCIHRDKDGILWIGTHQGLDQFNDKTNQFIHFQSVKSDPTTLSNNQVRVIYEDKQGILWIGTGSPYADNGGTPEDGGLNRIDKKTGTFTRYLHDPANNQSLISNKISAIYEDDKNVFWIGTALNGLHRMNRETGTFERLLFDPAHPEKLSGPKINPGTSSYKHITFFTQDAAGSYWYGTVDNGLYYFNPEVGKINHFQGSEQNTSGFTDNGAWKAFTSRDGIFWIGGTQGTIYHFNPLQQKITHIPISTAPVNSFFEDPDGTFWIGTAHDVIRIDKTKNITLRLGSELNPQKAATNEVYYIGRDHLGTLYAGSNQSLGIWDNKLKKFKIYQHDPKDENSLSSNGITDIFEDGQNNIWLSTFRGLNLMDRKTHQFSHYFPSPADLGPFGSNVMTTILEDKTGMFWVGGWNGSGINIFHPQTNRFVNYLKGSGIMCIYEDSKGILWTGGNDGLYTYNREIDNFVRFGDFDSMTGLTNAYSIVEDNQNYLWIGTTEGIVRINPLRNEISLFDQNYGIVKNSLSWGSALKAQNGNIYFGNTTGYYVINPEELLQNSKAPEIVITGFYIIDSQISPDKNGPLKENLSVTQEIRLKYNQNVFSFDFTVIDYSNPDQNRIIYYLENYDKTWLKPSSERRAYYFNIPTGNYTFHIKASNSDGVWAERKINIIILPPWWKSYWIYAFYVLLFFGAVFGFDRIMRRRIMLAEQRKNQEKELAQAKEIEKAYTELKSTQAQLIQSEKMASLGELTAGIAHEIQNPLNFVNNFSEVSNELIDEMNEELDKGDIAEAKSIAADIKQNLEKINHHGKRADAIVKGMLQHSRSSSGVKEPTDINVLADEYLRLSYHGLRAKDKSFNATMKTDFDESIGKINVVPQDIGRVILNLLTNAFYAVNDRKKALPPTEGGISKHHDNYEPTVTIKTSLNPPSGGRGALVSISVRDNGSGIPQSALDKIFQPFFTTKPTGEGTGLGLSMSYDIITKGHNGELKVETKEGEGTTFIVKLPV